MTRPRIRPSEVRQAQRLTRERAIELDEAQIGKLAGAHAFPLADYLERLRIDAQGEFETALAAVRDGAQIKVEAGSDRQTLERLDHNLDDLRSADEESEER